VNAQDLPEHLRTGQDAAPCVLLVLRDAVRERLVGEPFARRHFAIACESRAGEALDRLAVHAPGLVVLDAGVPGLDAREFCLGLRSKDGRVPLVVLADRADLVEQLLYLELGADACLPDDVPARLLWAQARAILRRCGGSEPSSPPAGEELRFGSFVLDRRAMQMTFRGQSVNLTLHEFDCAWLLAQRAGTVVHRDEFRSLVGSGRQGRIRGRLMDTYISRLRRKLLRVDPAFCRIRSVRSLGYLFSPAGL